MNLNSIIKSIKNNLELESEIYEYESDSIIVYIRHQDYYYALDELFINLNLDYKILDSGENSFIYKFLNLN